MKTFKKEATESLRHHGFWCRLLLGLLLTPIGLAGQELSPTEIAAVDSAMQAEMTRQGAVGLALGVLQEGKVVYLKGYGMEDRERRIPVGERTLFRWASISKTLTAVAAMQLVENGRLDLKADCREYVPEFPDHGARITPRLLLCHQGGIVHYSNGPVVVTRRKYEVEHPFESVILALDTFKESPLIAEPGEKYSYTTHGFILMSAVVERAGRQPFADQVRDRIATPLGLKSLQPDYQWKALPHRAVGYDKVLGVVVPSTDTDVSWKLGGGGYISTIGDLAGYAEGLLQGKLVSQETGRRMWTAQQTRSGERTAYGLGFRVEGEGRNLKVSHSGSQEKVKSRLVIYPRQGHGMVVFCNSEYVKPEGFTTAAYRALNQEP